jgi:hypothetical protein
MSAIQGNSHQFEYLNMVSLAAQSIYGAGAYLAGIATSATSYVCSPSRLLDLFKERTSTATISEPKLRIASPRKRGTIPQGILSQPKESVIQVYTDWSDDFFKHWQNTLREQPHANMKDYFKQNPLERSTIHHVFGTDHLHPKSFCDLQRLYNKAKKTRKLADMQSLVDAYFCHVKKEAMPLALRINELYKKHVCLPSFEELKTKPMKELHASWTKNQHLLLGACALKQIPRFGFHGTTEAGFVGIQRSKRTKCSHFFLAGYSYQLDPVSFLADLYTMARKARGYQNTNGAVLTITADRTNSSVYSDYIHPRRLWINFDLRYKALAEDSQGQLIFNSRVDRCDQMEPPDHLPGSTSDQSISTLNIYPAVELLTRFNPATFKSRVKAILPEAQSQYKDEEINQFQTVENWPRWVLAKRLQHQELIIHAFHHLGVLNPNDKLQPLVQEGNKIERNAHQYVHIVEKEWHKLWSEGIK